MNWSHVRLILLTALAAGAFGARQCQAVLRAYEGYDYTAGSGIVGENGGTGWANAWSGSAPSAGVGLRQIQSPGADYSSLETIGNKAFIAATNQTQRTLSAGVQGAADETVWVSFIGQRVGDNNIRFFGLSFYEGTTAAGNERFTIGAPSNSNGEWGAHFTSTAQGRVTVPGASINTESLLLARIDYHSAANDDIYLWVNPDLSLGEPSIGSAGASSIGAFNLAFDIVSTRAGTTSGGNHGEAIFDEIRIGTSYPDVTPGGFVCAMGDANCDGSIDVEIDFEAIRLNFRKSPRTRIEGDLTGDGTVDFADFREWKAAFLGSGASLEGLRLNFLTAPEPSSAGLLLVAALAIVTRRPKR